METINSTTTLNTIPAEKCSANLLELFAGSRSIGKAGERLGYNVFSVDWKPYEHIDLVIDIEALSKKDIPFVPDVIWASPDCTTYTIAAISHHRDGTEPKSDYAKKCDNLNRHFICLIKEWLLINPEMVFFIENPRGMLRKMPFMQEFKRHTVWYCQYGDDRAKPTDIWSNSNTWIPKPMCFNGNKNCHHQPAPRGSKTGTQGKKGSYNRSIVPNELCTEILECSKLKKVKDKFPDFIRPVQNDMLAVKPTLVYLNEPTTILRTNNMTLYHR